jgi:hypothetical protein
MDVPGEIAVEAETVATSAAGHGLTRLGAVGLAVTIFLLVLSDALRSVRTTYPDMPQL